MQCLICVLKGSLAAVWRSIKGAQQAVGSRARREGGGLIRRFPEWSGPMMVVACAEF